MATILIIDDESAILDALEYNLQREGHRVVTATDAFAALAILEELAPDLIISDIMMPAMDGIELCTRVRARPQTAETPFLFLTARGQSRDKFEALKLGADDYITKPFDLDDVIARVNGRLVHRERVLAMNAVRQSRSSDSIERPPPAQLEQPRSVEPVPAPPNDWTLPVPEPPADAAALRTRVAAWEARFDALKALRRTVLIGEHPTFLQAFEAILIAATSEDPTLIVGETGTGKTGVAEAVAALGRRSDAPFRTMNCAELAAGDATIALGRLFGYGKHSGLANIPAEGRPGVLEEVDGGVLFLDEVAALPAQAQSALLLPLEGRAFHPTVGTGTPRQVDVKFIFATNVDLARQAAGGEFPRDLYERIAGEVIEVPPLRARRSDVPLLAAHFLREVSDDTGRAGAEVNEVLTQYDWPGNVRELRRAIRVAWRRASLDGRTTIEVDDLPSAVLGRHSGAHRALRQSGPLRAVDASVEMNARELAELEALRKHEFRIGEASDELGLSRSSKTLTHRLRGMCFKALVLADYDLDAAARLIGGDHRDHAAQAARRIQDQVDRMNARLDEDADAHTRHLVADHRDFALVVLDRLRGQRRD